MACSTGGSKGESEGAVIREICAMYLWAIYGRTQAPNVLEGAVVSLADHSAQQGGGRRARKCLVEAKARHVLGYPPHVCLRLE